MANWRLAAAPISWGICDVPGWGWQMPYQRVLAEMSELGISATELGPAGFLPADPDEARAALEAAGLQPVGTYVDAVLHRADDQRWRELIAETAEYVRRAGADTVILAVLASDHSYDGAPALTDEEWTRLLQNLDEASAICREVGTTLALHPHLGTLVVGPSDIRRVLRGCSVGLCIDSGHAYAGGSDVVELLESAGDRLVAVHLKDVSSALVDRLNRGEIDFLQAIAEGIFRPLGDGNLPVEEILSALRDCGFAGWMVLEQDVALSSEPAREAGPREQVAMSLARVRAAST